MTDAFRELCVLVKEAGGTMKLHGVAMAPEQIEAYAADQATRRLDAAIARSVRRKAEEDAWRAVWMCQHAMTHRGKNIPLGPRGGSYQTEVCDACSCFRILTHHESRALTDWQPATLYATASKALLQEPW